MGMIRKSGIITESTAAPYPLKVGLDASKPVPRVGDTYLTTDTGKTYACYVNGTWTPVYSLSIDRYSNHNGTVDNFTQTATSINGTATTNAATHSMDLSSGITLAGDALYQTKSLFTPSVNALVASFKIDNIVVGIGANNHYTWIGFANDFQVASSGAMFTQNDDGSWSILTRKALTDTVLSTSQALANGDVVTILLTTTVALFFKNGILVATSTTNIPTAALRAGAYVAAVLPNLNTAQSISIDNFTVERF